MKFFFIIDTGRYLPMHPYKVLRTIQYALKVMATIKLAELEGAVVPPSLVEKQFTPFEAKAKCSLSSDKIELLMGGTLIATYQASEVFPLFGNDNVENRAKCEVYEVSEETEGEKVATHVATWFAKSVPSSKFPVEVRSSVFKGITYYFFSSTTAFKK